MQTIKVSDAVYQRLQDQAARLQVTPDQVLEQLLADSTTRDLIDAESDIDIPASGSTEALAAVKRLTTLFATSPLPNIDAVLADPMLALANAELDHLPQ